MGVPSVEHLRTLDPIARPLCPDDGSRQLRVVRSATRASKRGVNCGGPLGSHSPGSEEGLSQMKCLDAARFDNYGYSEIENSWSKVSILRGLISAVALLVPVGASGQTNPELQTYFRQNIGLSENQIASIQNGQPVVVKVGGQEANGSRARARSPLRGHEP